VARADNSRVRSIFVLRKHLRASRGRVAAAVADASVASVRVPLFLKAITS
jgi:hypothetical protein